MNQFGWTSVGWLDMPDAIPLRRWKWYGRDDVFVTTNDEAVLVVLSGALKEWELDV